MACRHSCRIWSFCNQKLSGYTKIHAILPMFSICSLIIQAFQILNRYFKMTLLFGNETFCQENSRDSESAWKLMRNRRRKFFNTFLFYRWIFEKFCKLLWTFARFLHGRPWIFNVSKKISINAIIEHTKNSYKFRRVSIHVFRIWSKIVFTYSGHLLRKHLHWKVPNLHNSKKLACPFSTKNASPIIFLFY